MQVNLPVWSYYPKDDSSPYVDGLFAPYQYKEISTPDGVCKVNTFAQNGCPDGMFNPNLVRKGWGQNFQLMFPDRDSCPESWSKGIDGFCYKNQPEFDVNFGLYSSHAFVPFFQYYNGYASEKQSDQIEPLDSYSINPWSGRYVVYHKGKPSKNTNKYLRLPSKDSMLA